MSLASPYHDADGKPLAQITTRHPKEITRGQLPPSPPDYVYTRPLGPPPAPAAETPDADAAAAAQLRNKRSIAARKAAATLRTRREQAATKAAANKLLNESLDRIAAAAVKHKDDPPGTPTAKALIERSRALNLEHALYRQAHITRAGQRPDHWTAHARQALGQFLDSQTAITNTKRKRP